MKDKIMSAQFNAKEGIDLLIERDSGNLVLILMSGRADYCLANWKRLKDVCDTAIEELEVRVSDAI